MAYSVKKKAFHLRFMEQRFNEHYEGCEKCASGNTVVSVGLSLAGRETQCRKRRGDEWGHEGVRFHQNFWRQRFASRFGDELVAAEDIRLAEFHFPYTTETSIYLTAALKRESDGREEGEGERYRVLYGIARFG